MTATLAEPEPAHVCVYRSPYGCGWSCTYGYSMGWALCPIAAVADALETEAAHAWGGNDGTA